MFVVKSVRKKIGGRDRTESMEGVCIVFVCRKISERARKGGARRGHRRGGDWSTMYAPDVCPGAIDVTYLTSPETTMIKSKQFHASRMYAPGPS